MARELGLDVEAYHNLVANSVSVEDGSIDDLYTDQTMEFADQCERADNEMENAELRELLSNCIADLPEREALVLQLFFVEERNLDEIGSILGVGAARVCQIKKKAIERLQVSMQADAWGGERR
jgi:RNA polymerase sigma factor for flagellar operon FliA